MSYPESVQYLYALGNELKVGAKFGLERMQALLKGLGNPERGQRFIHVAGTNGKGSTCAMMASALHAAGLRTGLYSSPHLIEPVERIQLNGIAVNTDVFAQAFETVHAVAERMLLAGELDAHPSYFETVTAMALLLFRDERCDVVVLEVGLGGRLDATNVIDPALCVITPVAYDHEAYLGNTLQQIAAEKAGILKPVVPVVMASQLPEAETVILDHAQKLGCDLVRAADHPISNAIVTDQNSSFTIAGKTYECGLAGRHQMENARAAILALKMLDIPVEAIREGLRTVEWPGRLEFVSHNPDFVLDGAHNPAGAAALAAYIREFHADRPVWLVYGAMRDKAVEEVIEQLFPLAACLIVTAANFPRALRPQAILDMTDHSNAVRADNVAAAIELARRAPKDAIVFFTGSLFIVGEARTLFRRMNLP